MGGPDRGPSRWGMTPDDHDPLTVVPTLSVRSGQPQGEHVPAAQGPAPADLAGREAPPVPSPSGDGLSAREVAALIGADRGEEETNLALEAAEGLSPGTES